MSPKDLRNKAVASFFISEWSLLPALAHSSWNVIELPMCDVLQYFLLDLGPEFYICREPFNLMFARPISGRRSPRFDVVPRGRKDNTLEAVVFPIGSRGQEAH